MASDTVNDDIRNFDWFLIKSGDQGIMSNQIQKKLERLLTDYEFRAQLMSNIGPYSFGSNKKEVLREILSLFKDV